MRTLFLHVPKFNNFYKPVGEFIWINYMPMGFLAVADYVRRAGFPVEVVHVGVEWINDRSFRLDSLFQDRPEIGAVGLNLHWHYQAFDVMEAALRIKELRPDLFIFLGGFTASYFHREILEDFPAVDAIVRGDGEVPALELLQALHSGGSLSAVPNLTWRDGREVIANPITYIGDKDTLDALDFTDFSLIRNASTYVQYVGLPFFFAKSFSKQQNFKRFTIRSPLMPVPVGRGCPFNCTWCGGSHLAQKRYISCRTGFVYRDQEAVIDSIRAGLQAGYRTMHTATDPEPANQEYFIELWRRIRKAGIQTNWMFECFGLPTDRFVEEFRKTFPGPDSILAISPESGNEGLRKRHKGPGFSDAAFFDSLDRIDGLGIATEIFFSYGLPGENEDLLQDTIEMRKTIMRRYRHVRGMRSLSIEMEPGAPWQIDPEGHGIVTDRKSFRDFYLAHADGHESTYTAFGYYIPDFFHQPLDPERPYADFAERLQRIKCRKLCFIHPNPKKYGRPWQGRLFCSLASNLIKLKPSNHSRPF